MQIKRAVVFSIQYVDKHRPAEEATLIGVYNKARGLEQCHQNLPTESMRAQRLNSLLEVYRDVIICVCIQQTGSGCDFIESYINSGKCCIS